MKWLLRFSVVSTLAALLAAGTALIWDCSELPQPAFVVSQTEFKFSDIAVGECDFVIRIANPATVSRSIIGLEEG